MAKLNSKMVENWIQQLTIIKEEIDQVDMPHSYALLVARPGSGCILQGRCRWTTQ